MTGYKVAQLSPGGKFKTQAGTISHAFTGAETAWLANRVIITEEISLFSAVLDSEMESGNQAKNDLPGSADVSLAS
jgi:hypothetical protein